MRLLRIRLISSFTEKVEYYCLKASTLMCMFFSISYKSVFHLHLKCNQLEHVDCAAILNHGTEALDYILVLYALRLTLLKSRYCYCELKLEF
jgi:hypothetical protein